MHERIDGALREFRRPDQDGLAIDFRAFEILSEAAQRAVT